MYSGSAHIRRDILMFININKTRVSRKSQFSSTLLLLTTRRLLHWFWYISVRFTPAQFIGLRPFAPKGADVMQDLYFPSSMLSKLCNVLLWERQNSTVLKMYGTCICVTRGLRTCTLFRMWNRGTQLGLWQIFWNHGLCELQFLHPPPSKGVKQIVRPIPISEILITHCALGLLQSVHSPTWLCSLTQDNTYYHFTGSNTGDPKLKLHATHRHVFFLTANVMLLASTDPAIYFFTLYICSSFFTEQIDVLLIVHLYRSPTCFPSVFNVS